MKQQYSPYIAWVCILSILMPSFVFSSEQEFNPSFLISDEEMQNAQSMNRGDIQAFLTHHNGYVSRLTTNDVSSTPRLASDIIYRAAQKHTINPKYLLVKLQKEQSLITDQDPTQKQLDWATGYGICDACSMSDPALQKHRGFGTQVDSAAGIIRWYYNNVGQRPWIKKKNTAYTIDGRQVIPANLATAFLYTYTPHIQGNQNFWKLWTRWFEQVYPDGSLVKTTDDSTIYVILNGKKRAFDSMSALVTRFDPKLVITVPPSELGRYESGPSISLPNYAVLKNGSTYYLLDFDTIRQFESYDVVKKLGYHPDEFIDVTDQDIAPYTRGELIVASNAAPLGRIVRVKENNNLYYINGTLFHPVGSGHIAQINFPHLSIDKVGATAVQGLTLGPAITFKNGTLFGITGHNEIYVVENAKKRHIASEDVFNGMGYDWENIIWVDELTGLAHQTGQPIYLQRQIQPVSATTAVAEPTNPKAELMYRTPADKTTYVGENYPANLNTFAIADYETGEILAGKNIDDKRPLASLTKVMTAYRLLQEGLRDARYVAYDPADHKSLYHRYRIAAGEEVFNKDLFDVMLVSSLNTPVRMLVDSVEEKEKDFVKRMNEQAKTWGLSNTTFVDPAGVEVENMTTAREYLTLYTKATKLAKVKEVLGKKSYRYAERKDTDGKPDHFDTHSNDLVEQSGLSFSILSSKTGYLDEAGANLVMHVKRNRDGREFVILTMGNPNYTQRFAEPRQIAQWAMETL